MRPSEIYAALTLSAEPWHADLARTSAFLGLVAGDDDVTPERKGEPARLAFATKALGEGRDGRAVSLVVAYWDDVPLGFLLQSGAQVRRHVTDIRGWKRARAHCEGYLLSACPEASYSDVGWDVPLHVGECTVAACGEALRVVPRSHLDDDGALAFDVDLFVRRYEAEVRSGPRVPHRHEAFDAVKRIAADAFGPHARVLHVPDDFDLPGSVRYPGEFRLAVRSGEAVHYVILPRAALDGRYLQAFNVTVERAEDTAAFDALAASDLAPAP